ERQRVIGALALEHPASPRDRAVVGGVARREAPRELRLRGGELGRDVPAPRRRACRASRAATMLREARGAEARDLVEDGVIERGVALEEDGRAAGARDEIVDGVRDRVRVRVEVEAVLLDAAGDVDHADAIERI